MSAEKSHQAAYINNAFSSESKVSPIIDENKIENLNHE